MSSEPVLDILILKDFLPELEDNLEEAEEEITFFITHARKHQRSTQEAISAEDWQTLDEQAHRLGSSAAMFGLMRLSVACRVVEERISAGERQTVSELAQQIPALIDEAVRELKLVLETKQKSAI